MSHHSVFETDTRGLLAGRGLFPLFNFYLQLNYDRLSFVSEITGSPAPIPEAPSTCQSIILTGGVWYLLLILLQRFQEMGHYSI